MNRILLLLFVVIVVGTTTNNCNGKKLIATTAFLVSPCSNKMVNVDIDDKTNAFNVDIINKTFDGCPWHVNSAAMNKEKNLFYVLRRHEENASPLFITTYNAKSGAELSSVELSDKELRSLYAVWFDNDLQKMICIILNQTTVNWTAATIDPKSGLIQEVVNLHKLSKDIGAFDMAFSGYDARKKILYQMVETQKSVNTLLSINIEDPSKSTAVYLSSGDEFSGNFLMASTFYNGELFGFLNNLTLAKFDLKTGAVVVFDVPPILDVPPTEQFLIASWHAVIDETEEKLYISCTVNPEQMPPELKTTFFSIDINNVKVLLKKPVDAGPLMFLHLMKDD